MGISPQNAVSTGAVAFHSLRGFLGRGAKIGGPVAGVCGAVADLASTIGAFSLYLFIASLVVALVSGTTWFARSRRAFQAAAAGRLTTAEAVGEHNVWSLTFAFAIVASIVMGGFVLVEKVSGGDGKGALATVIPGMDKVQEALFRVEKKIDEVKADTTAIREDTAATRKDTARIANSLDEIAKRFDSLATNRGLIANAKSPEEHYHNARIHELGGNFTAARKEYADFLASNLDVIDPWQSYAAMLKAQEGRSGAVETLRYFGDKLQPRTLSYQTTLAMLEEGDSRLQKLQSLATLNPLYGPLSWLVSQEFSEMRRGEQTLAHQRSEKEWLEKFRAAHTAGRVERFFLDKREAQRWVESAEARWAKLSSLPARVLENPVTLTAQQSGAGWAVIFSLTDFRAKELFYRLDGQGPFESTGHLPSANPQTGLPMINLHVPLPNLTAGEHTAEVNYVDRNGQTNGPYTLKFSTTDQQLAQGKMMLNATAGSWLTFRGYDGKVLLYFTHLMSYRPLLREVRYSINSDALDRTFKFKPSDKMYEPGDDVYLAVQSDSLFAMVQVTYKDGTKSSVQKIMRVN